MSSESTITATIRHKLPSRFLVWSDDVLKLIKIRRETTGSGHHVRRLVGTYRVSGKCQFSKTWESNCNLFDVVQRQWIMQKYCLEFLKRISFYFKSYHLVIILGDWYVILCSNWRQEYLVNTLGPLRNVLKVIFVVRCIFILGVSISPPAYHSWGDTCCSQKMFDF